MKLTFKIKLLLIFAIGLKNLNYAVYIKDRIIIFNVKIANLYYMYLR